MRVVRNLRYSCWRRERKDIQCSRSTCVQTCVQEVVGNVPPAPKQPRRPTVTWRTPVQHSTKLLSIILNEDWHVTIVKSGGRCEKIDETLLRRKLLVCSCGLASVGLSLVKNCEDPEQSLPLASTTAKIALGHSLCTSEKFVRNRTKKCLEQSNGNRVEWKDRTVVVQTIRGQKIVCVLWLSLVVCRWGGHCQFQLWVFVRGLPQ